MPQGYFDRTPSIRTEQQMRERLAMRTGKLVLGSGDGADTVPPVTLPTAPTPSLLQWLPPERNPDGSGRQFDSTRTYEVRKSVRGAMLTYWAWTTTTKKLLGYHPTVEHCRELCEVHRRNHEIPQSDLVSVSESP